MKLAQQLGKYPGGTHESGCTHALEEKCKKGKVYLRSQILKHPSIGEYWDTYGVPVLPESVIFTLFRTC